MNDNQYLGRSCSFSGLLLGALLLLLTACGGGGAAVRATPVAPAPPPDPSPPTGLLVPFASSADMVDSVQASFERQLQTFRVASADSPASTAPEASTAFTTTYTQETSVDEHDVIKYDGDRMFVAPSRGMGCCFIAVDTEPAVDLLPADSAIPEPGQSDPQDRAIRILTTTPETASVRETGRIALSGSDTVEGLYLEGERLAAITSSAWWGGYGQRFADVQAWSGQHYGMTLYDINASDTPVVRHLQVEGTFVTSRRTSAGIYLISRHTPAINELNYYPTTDADQLANERLLGSLEIASLLPKVQLDGEEITAFSVAQCYGIDPRHPLAPEIQGFPTITSMLLVDPQSGEIKDSLCYAEATDGVYLSGEALYLVQGVYEADSSSGFGTQTTLVHKFNLATGFSYSGSGEVEGSLYLGNNRDFRISEQSGLLHLVTTQFTDDAADRWHHQLFILAKNQSLPELEIIGQLPNSLRPDAIGKPNEDLYGVRFLGDRAYLVTFERTDPLYVLDLANPRDPKVAGELEVTGFSNFLHPVSRDLLLGLGQSAERRVKLELFDVSDLTNPVSRGSLEPGPTLMYTYSSAEYDRHGFTYLHREAGHDRFAIPVQGVQLVDEEYSNVARLYLFEVREQTEPSLASLAEQGYLEATGPSADHYSTDSSRSILDGDAVYFVHDTQVYSALWNDPYNQTGPH